MLKLVGCEPALSSQSHKNLGMVVMVATVPRMSLDETVVAMELVVSPLRPRKGIRTAAVDVANAERAV